MGICGDGFSTSEVEEYSLPVIVSFLYEASKASSVDELCLDLGAIVSGCFIFQVLESSVNLKGRRRLFDTSKLQSLQDFIGDFLFYVFHRDDDRGSEQEFD